MEQILLQMTAREMEAPRPTAETDIDPEARPLSVGNSKQQEAPSTFVWAERGTEQTFDSKIAGPKSSDASSVAEVMYLVLDFKNVP